VIGIRGVQFLRRKTAPKLAPIERSIAIAVEAIKYGGCRFFCLPKVNRAIVVSINSIEWIA
jgi:ActR/RegA family two-component response regulator